MSCEVLYVVLSPMDGYHAQGNTLECPQSHTRKVFGNVPWCFSKLTYIFKSGYVARICSQQQCTTEVFGEVGGKRCSRCVPSVMHS